MAVKPLTKLVLIGIIILTGIAAALGARSRFLHYQKAEENRFIRTYLAMSLARERYIGNQDSLRIAFNDIFKKYGTDSAWMASYGKKLSQDLSRSERVWADITDILDSLKTASETDSLKISHRYQP
jgi:hypothetical protein